MNTLNLIFNQTVLIKIFACFMQFNAFLCVFMLFFVFLCLSMWFYAVICVPMNFYAFLWISMFFMHFFVFLCAFMIFYVFYVNQCFLPPSLWKIQTRCPYYPRNHKKSQSNFEQKQQEKQKHHKESLLVSNVTQTQAVHNSFIE